VLREDVGQAIRAVPQDVSSVSASPRISRCVLLSAAPHLCADDALLASPPPVCPSFPLRLAQLRYTERHATQSSMQCTPSSAVATSPRSSSGFCGRPHRCGAAFSALSSLALHPA
jgi:hypothetical protein